MGGKGSGGFNKISIEEHLRRGTWRRDRHGDLPEALKAVKKELSAKTLPAKPIDKVKSGQFPPCPDSLDTIGRVEWVKVCARLEEKGLLETSFVSAIEGYCEAYSRWRRAIKELEDGFTYIYTDTKTFKMKRSQKPEVIIAKDALNQMKAFLNDLGLTPKNIVVAPTVKESELDKFLDEQARKL
jgi:P27 family predicted phage terminase small subunit